MKIAMIGHKRIPSREGGIEIVVDKISTELVKRGHTVVAYNRKGHHVSGKEFGNGKKLKEYNGIKLKTVFTFQSSSLNAIVYSLIAAIRAGLSKFDVVHIHAEGPASMCFLPKLFGKRTIVTIHGLDWQRSKWGGFAAKFLKFGEKVAVKYADEIIVLSKNMQQYFEDTYHRKTRFIPNGVMKPVYKKPKVIKEQYGLDKENYILFLARIVPEKGLQYLIDAYKQLDTQMKLVIAGGSSHTDEYVEKIKQMVSKDENIIMTGFIQNEELQELYSNCYLYCLPSDVEGMPISLLEAMSYGRNCLVSNIAENTEVCGDYAAIFKKGDVEDLKIKLKQCLVEKDRKKAEEISNYILTKYNWEDIVDKTEKLYRKDHIEEEV